MERLTQTSDKGGVAFTFDLDVTCRLSEMKKILKLAEKLKAYEDAEEQGLQLRVPVAVGGKVYEIIEETVPNNYFYISEHEVQDVSAKAVKYADDWCEYGDPNLYFTRAEAEQALADKGV